MAYIAPNSIIRILHNVPLDTSYDHTIYWNNATTQRDYFASLVKPNTSDANFGAITFTLTNQSYQRVNRNYIRVEIPSDYLYDCNYLMFQNTNFGAKWFYAFIKKIEYVNNRVSEIEYELDVMQTWHFDYHPEDCFVEREHSVTDNIGENTVPENLEIGDYLFIDGGHSFENSNVPSDFDPWQIDPPEYPSDFCVCICAPFKVIDIWGTPSLSLDATAGFYNGIFGGLYYNIFPLDTLQDWQNLVDYLSEGVIGDGKTHLSEKRREEIVAIFMMPKYLISEWSKYPNTSAKGIGIIKQKYTDWSKNIDGTSRSGFVPKNNKLYTYPYNTLYVTSSDGDSSYFKYELFNSSTCNFMLEGAMGVPPEIGLTPVGYSCVDSISTKNYNYTLSVKNIPMCSWGTDAFKAWLAQNATRMVLGTGLAIASGAAGLGYIAASSQASNFIAATAEARKTLSTISTVGSVANNISQTLPAMLQPNHTHGVSKAMLGMANNEFGYHYYYARIKDEYAQIIDDFFYRYGYATRRNKQPNRTSRPCWNYVKTLGCTITGTIPCDDAKTICMIYDNGITFWHNVNNGVSVGDYSQNNTPGGGA